MAGAGVAPSRAAAVEQVGLVVGHEAWLVAGAELVEDGLHGRPVLLEVGIGRVDDLDEDVGPVDLLERRPERVDELVRELVDEAHGVGHDRGLPVAELDLAAGGIERGEQLVLGERHLGADEGVEQRRLAGVRVADDADGRPQPAVAAAGRGRALLADLLDALLHLGDAGPDDPAVGLELALAGAARPDPALGAREVGPHLGEPRQLVLELGELDLEAALVGLRVEREDVEDQPAPVDDLDLDELLERALLGRRELVVGDEQVEPGLALGGHEILGLALAHVPVRVDVAAVLPLGADDVGAGRGREVGQLQERVLGVPAVRVTGVDGDEEGFLDGWGEVDQVVGHGAKDSRSAAVRRSDAAASEPRQIRPLHVHRVDRDAVGERDREPIDLGEAEARVDRHAGQARPQEEAPEALGVERPPRTPPGSAWRSPDACGRGG